MVGTTGMESGKDNGEISVYEYGGQQGDRRPVLVHVLLHANLQCYFSEHRPLKGIP